MKLYSDKELLLHIWETAERKDTQLNRRLYKWLNKDSLYDVIIDDGVYWFELTTSRTVMPNYIFNYLKRLCNSKGLTYLYDLKGY